MLSVDDSSSTIINIVLFGIFTGITFFIDFVHL